MVAVALHNQVLFGPIRFDGDLAFADDTTGPLLAGGATTGAWPGYQSFGGWKGSGSTGKAAGSFYYVQQYMHEQSQTVID